MSEFCQVIVFDQCGEGDCPARGVIADMAAKPLTRFLHFVENGFAQWEILCALEDELIAHRENEGWTFVAGSIFGDDETKGWMEHEGWIVVPYGPALKQGGADIGLWSSEEFDNVTHTAYAKAPAADESGIAINAILKLGERVDAVCA